ncbi:MAG TPA: NUDIX hydrolase, partial [Solirubrobacteraceae bacterium]
MGSEEDHGEASEPSSSTPPAADVSASTRSPSDDRPAPGEDYNPRWQGDPTRPRRAATVILLRGGTDALEVLLVRRTPAAKFMGGVWVFPGGAVD